ncbi:MAG: single-stranded DNA-binding protein [Armatimonadota bacterium]|nr:single-stranded DNA-binding protein [Armatimonadota bacterium]MDR7448036.1 single-stranded DNA-binding protein [Armatimonadota bacterium]MDR7459585.1 single-stranded DNA-binding protein [Armatimonadota bacterium]MDR7478630.1 single-stranded DNA-binding protein [Armatimonadota bacterium]MDR7488025.1 single-stranded DNA-binding protein [Armatimonadota bacterium]
MLNRIILIGRLTRDPELRYVPSGQPVASFTLAVDRPFTNQAGERETDFIDVVAWRKLADQVAQHLTKGRLVAVEGRLQIRSYETQEGQKRKVAEVVADAVRFLDRKAAPVAAGAVAAAEEGEEFGGADDVPF